MGSNERKAELTKDLPAILAESNAPTPAELADRAALSRFHYQRVFKRIMGETPGELRRRLLLERAATNLSKGRLSVTEAAFEACFETLDGFTRAFRKAFGLNPSEFAKAGIRSCLLPSPNGVHFGTMQGEAKMDFLDRIWEQDAWFLAKLLDRAERLTEEELDREVVSSEVTPWDGELRSVRALLDRLVLTIEIWVAAVDKKPFPEERDKSVAGIRRRHEIAHPMLVGLARRVRDENQWDTTFVDELCEPPETFTFAGMLAHVATFGIARRQATFDAMRKLGVDDIGYGDPIEWERSRDVP